ncbi:MAG TPA: hypothetical protein VF142_11410 [Longimicrobium sp.]
MLIQLLQVAASGFLFLFGLLALQVRRRAGPAWRDRATLAWSAATAYFLIGGGYAAVHAALAAASYVVGYTSPFGRWVGSWAIQASVARGVVAVAFGAMVLALMVMRRRLHHLARSIAPALALMALVATLVTLQLSVRWDPFTTSTTLAVLNGLTAILIMGALFAAVLNDGMDQLLWLSLALYALKETLSVSQLAVMAWWSLVPQSDVYYFLYASGVVVGAAMCGVAVRRLRLATQGRRVPALFERLYPERRAHVS